MPYEIQTSAVQWGSAPDCLILLDLGGTDVLAFTNNFVSGTNMCQVRVARLTGFEDVWQLGSIVTLGTVTGFTNVHSPCAVMLTATSGIFCWSRHVTAGGYFTIHAVGFSVSDMTVTVGAEIEFVTNDWHGSDHQAYVYELERISDSQAIAVWARTGDGLLGTTRLNLSGSTVSPLSDTPTSVNVLTATGGSLTVRPRMADNFTKIVYAYSSGVPDMRVAMASVGGSEISNIQIATSTLGGTNFALAWVQGELLLAYTRGASHTNAERRLRFRKLTVTSILTAGTEVTPNFPGQPTQNPTAFQFEFRDLEAGYFHLWQTISNTTAVARYHLDTMNMPDPWDQPWDYSGIGSSGSSRGVPVGGIVRPTTIQNDQDVALPFRYLYYGNQFSQNWIRGVAWVEETLPPTVCRWQPAGEECDEFYQRNAHPVTKSKWMGQVGTTGPVLGSLLSAQNEACWMPSYDCLDSTRAIMAYSTYDSDDIDWPEWRFAVLVNRDDEDLGWTSRIRLGPDYAVYSSNFIYDDLIALDDTYAIAFWFRPDPVVGDALPTIALIKRTGSTIAVVDGPTAVQFGYAHPNGSYEANAIWGATLEKVTDNFALLAYSTDAYHATQWGKTALRALERSGDTLIIHSENIHTASRNPQDDAMPRTCVLGLRGDGRYYFQTSYQQSTLDNWWARYVCTCSIDPINLDSITYHSATMLCRSVTDYVNPPPDAARVDATRAAWVLASETLEGCPDPYVAINGGYTANTTVICATSTGSGISIGNELMLDGAWDTGDPGFGSYNPQPWHMYINKVNGKLVVTWNRDVRPPKYPILEVDLIEFGSEMVQITLTPNSGDVCSWGVCGGLGDVWSTGHGYFYVAQDGRPRVWPGSNKLLIAGGNAQLYYWILDPLLRVDSLDNYDWSGWTYTAPSPEEFFGIIAFNVIGPCLESVVGKWGVG